MELIFLGPPGAGKGTQAARLSSELGVPQISTGEILREAVRTGKSLGAQAAPLMAAGKLVPDDIVLQIVEDRLMEKDCSTGFLLDGFPRTVTQATALSDFLATRARGIDFVISLEVPDAVLLERTKARGRTDDSLGTMKQRLDVFREQTEPVKAYYLTRGVLRPVNGVGTVDEVAARIRNEVASPKREA